MQCWRLAAVLLLAIGWVAPHALAAAAAPGPPAQGVDSGAELGDPEAAPVQRAVDTPIAIAWRTPSRDLGERVRIARAAALGLGVLEIEVAARALLAEPEGEISVARATAAVQLSPSLPSAQLALAKAHWRERELLAALPAALAALAALERDLEASLWLRASAAILLCATLLGGPLLFIGLAGAAVARHAAHDIGDWISGEMPEFARAALLGLAVLAPGLLGEGPMGVALLAFAVACLFGDRGQRLALVTAAVLLLAGVFFAPRLAGSWLGALDSDPVAHAISSAEEGYASPVEIARLERAALHDPLAGAALALRAKRAGDLEAAAARYAVLREARPDDPVLANNAANVHLALGNTRTAMELYNVATDGLDSALVYHNLSQAYGQAIRPADQDRALARAQELDFAVVDDFSDLHAVLGMPFVADLSTPLAELRDRLRARESGDRSAALLVAFLAPGALGRSATACAIAFAAVALLAPLVARRQRSACCSRCGRRVCPRCDGASLSGSMCPSCIRLSRRPETTDPALRMARLTELRRRQERRERLEFAVSLFVPGAAGLIAGRPLLGLLGALSFAALATCVIGSPGSLSDSFAPGGTGRLATLLVASLSGALYLGVLASAIRGRGNN